MILSDIDDCNHDLNSLDYLTNHPSVEFPPQVGAEVMAENLEDCQSKFPGHNFYSRRFASFTLSLQGSQ